VNYKIDSVHQINGLILAGGESSRMGSDKSLVHFHGKPQREFLNELLLKFCKKVFLSCKPRTTYPDWMNTLVDQYEIKGPFNGILTALSSDPATAWLTVPVDMPNINEESISILLKERDAQKVATCFFDSDGTHPEPLFAIWEPKASELAVNFYRTGQSSPREFLMTHDVKVVKSPTPMLHVNVNSPEDLRKYFNDHDHSE
jgi:molybdenum cofactor guanylyltransferase